MMTTRLARHPLLTIGVVVLLLSQACFSARPWRTQDRPWDPRVLAKAAQVRVHMVDGTEAVLVDVTLEEGPQGTFLRGTVIDDQGQRRSPVVLPAYKVSQLETRKLEALRLAAKIGVWAGIVVVGGYLVLVIGALCALGGGRCLSRVAPVGIVGGLPARGRQALLLPSLAAARRVV